MYQAYSLVLVLFALLSSTRAYRLPSITVSVEGQDIEGCGNYRTVV